MRQHILSAAIAVAMLSSTSGSASPAQAVVSGIYELDTARSDNAFKVIDSATATISDDKRPRVRMRLRKSIAVNRIRISTAGGRVGLAYDAKTPIVVWIGGDPITWKLIPELVFDVSVKADGGTVALTFRGDDSERTSKYHSVGQDLMENTTIISPLLSTPIVYKQVFKKIS
ncbi:MULTISPECIES: hypothetical protein [unclassified Sphingomonas]|jgi:hypothetical protein|uniref:hypothetical protein n=1 Tax=unclassified Sphingomonas TaxID=196159 RepID=UPI000B2CB6A1|nr:MULTISPECIES: hypothetical protein [unclassified Sphingomonas]MBD8552191.1 hypothetical protein [Sphingomonas sp. CFBP 8764]